MTPHFNYGYSKDKRPDLKKFMVSMICVEGNIPISGKMQNGNSSDEKLSNEKLRRIARLLEPLGKNVSEFIYVADCKFLTTDNLKKLGDTLFISRFPVRRKNVNPRSSQNLQSTVWSGKVILLPQGAADR
jgi:transposase